MTKTVRTSTPAGQANKVAGQATDRRQPDGDRRQGGAALSPSVESEIHGALARALRQHKAETIAGECGVDRATIYKWAAKPSRVPLSILPTLASFDPDPEFLARVAGCLLSVVAASALARKAQGGAVSIFHEIAPGRWVR